MQEFSFRTRKSNIKKIKNNRFDLVVIGGGITGAGVARDAAMRGLKVALVEARDFAIGTSSRSSKLVHGGIRYLENFEFHLVFEALSERSKLFEIAPTLVHPLRFMIPIFESSRVGLFKMGLGMMLYDMLSLFQTPEMHEKLSAQKTLQRMPIVRANDLVGSCVYSDAYMDDDRLVHETLRAAHEHNAICANYVRVEKSVLSAENKVKSLDLVDQLNGENFSVSCDHVVSTVGPWTDLVGPTLVNDWKLLLRPTKGIHLTFAKSRLNLTSAVVMAAQESNRIVFAIPRHEMIIIGTTDTDYRGNPADVKATADDVQYLLKITNDYFPGAHLTEKDIVSSYVGVRPLVQDNSGSEGKTSREHVIIDDERGFTFVAGGKYTTYRLMSEQIVDEVLKHWSIEKRMSVQHCQTTQPLNQYIATEALAEAQVRAKTDLEKKLVFRHGAEAFEILKKYGEGDYWELEALQAIENTMCFNLTDFCVRRVPLMLATTDHGLSLLNQIANVFQKQLGWTEQEKENQKELYRQHIKNELSWHSTADT